MFSRWRQENFFRYMRAHYALDGPDVYTTTPDGLIPNPARKQADRQLQQARQACNKPKPKKAVPPSPAAAPPPTPPRSSTRSPRPEPKSKQLRSAARAIPAKAPIAHSQPDATRLDPERKRIHDAIRMATYNAETALVRLLAPQYPRADDEARSLSASLPQPRHLVIAARVQERLAEDTGERISHEEVVATMGWAPEAAPAPKRSSRKPTSH